MSIFEKMLPHPPIDGDDGREGRYHHIKAVLAQRLHRGKSIDILIERATSPSPSLAGQRGQFNLGAGVSLNLATPFQKREREDRLIEEAKTRFILLVCTLLCALARFVSYRAESTSYLEV